MKTIDWNFHRPGCPSCGKTQEFLTKNKIGVVEQLDAKKHPIDRVEAESVLRKASTVYVVKGKKVLEFDMKTANIEDVLAVAIGPFGNLRAPAFLKGSTLVVGFEPSAYEKVLLK